ncbi:MAG: SLC13 family permease [Planctomycetota bacterium]|nr:SLC13 family permease [Planctomycetota bacterium]
MPYLDTQTRINPRIAETLLAAPILKNCNRKLIARLVPHVTELKFRPGEKLFEAGSPATQCYILQAGAVKLSENGRILEAVHGGFVGEEAAVDGSTYLSDAEAVSEVVALALPRDALKFLAKENPKTKAGFFHLLINHFAQQHDFTVSDKGEKEEGKSWLEPVGWVFAIVVPIFVYFWASGAGLETRETNYLAIFSATTIMWAFRLFPEYIPAIFVVLASIILGVVPTERVLSGFASGSFFMAMSVFGIGSVLVRSGLTYRLSLWLLRHAPNSQLGYECSMMLVGLLLTPILPSANGRVGLLAPLVEDMVESIRYKRGQGAATRLAAAAFTGTTALSAVFLTSKSINFAVYDLFPSQVKFQFTWGYWIVAGAAVGLVIVLGHFLLSAVLFRNKERPYMNRERIASQFRVMGPMSRDEWIALGGIVFFVVGALSVALHKVEPPWIGLAVLYMLINIGVFSKTDLRKEIDWPFLLMLAGMVSIVNTMNALKLDDLLKQHVEWMGEYMHDNLYVFLVLLSLVIFAVRLVLPNNAAIILMCAIFLPIADEQGISAWIVAFIILHVSDGWFMAYQCTYYLQWQEELEGGENQELYDRRKMLLYNLFSNLIRVGAVFVSVPYWKMLGLL